MEENPVEMHDDACEQRKHRIAEALLANNPQLEQFEFDYEKIASLQHISLEEARTQYAHIELNTPEGEHATQITISDYEVVITIPYWYEGEQAQAIFQKISTYLKIINNEAGYFVYDPQTEQVFDPQHEEFGNVEGYESMTRKMPEIALKAAKEMEAAKGQKPWWKFW